MKPPSPRPISTVSMGVTDELAQKYGFKNAAEYEEFLAKHNGAA
jgi:hypothetical protein